MTTITISGTTKESPWMTLNQVAKYFSVSERTISRMIDHMSYGIHYVKENPYKKRSKLIFHIVQLERLWKSPVPSFRQKLISITTHKHKKKIIVISS